MGLDKDTRKCQIETYDDCKTRLYIEHLRKECGCLPLSLRLSGEVKHIIDNLLSLSNVSSPSPKSKVKAKRIWANPIVRLGTTQPKSCFDKNVTGVPNIQTLVRITSVLPDSKSGLCGQGLSWSLMGKMTFRRAKSYAKVVHTIETDVLNIQIPVRITPVLPDFKSRLCGQGLSW